MARQLRRAGWKQARALIGGWDAWRAAGLSVEPIPEWSGQAVVQKTRRYREGEGS